MLLRGKAHTPASSGEGPIRVRNRRASELRSQDPVHVSLLGDRPRQKLSDIGALERSSMDRHAIYLPHKKSSHWRNRTSEQPHTETKNRIFTAETPRTTRCTSSYEAFWLGKLGRALLT